VSLRPARGGPGADLLQLAPLTVALIAVNVLVYVLQKQDTAPVLVHGAGASGPLLAEGPVEAHGVLWGPAVAAGDWWRLLTSGFLHANIAHLGTNMLSLFFLGRSLEPALGWLRCGLIYVVSLAAGSLGVMLVSPGDGALGASGAIFGLAGALLVVGLVAGLDILRSGLGPMILLNLVITFTVPGISIGAHVGGLVAGAAMAAAMLKLRRPGRPSVRPFAALALASFAALLVVSVLVARAKYAGSA
jgi:membrane associated rhomboid family serine protease